MKAFEQETISGVGCNHCKISVGLMGIGGNVALQVIH